MDASSILTVDRLTKRYQSQGRALTVLDNVTFSLKRGTSCAIMGPSGSGKTTLLGLCAGLDLPDEGSVHVDGVALKSLSEEERARLRRERIGFVFQSFRLIPTLTSLENVMVPLELLGRPAARKEAQEILGRVGLKDRMHHFPPQLSGGEQQRVGIARAFIHRPLILFADEPTGNLDLNTGEHVTQLLFDLNRIHGTALVIVTHNETLAQRTGRILKLAGGRLASG